MQPTRFQRTTSCWRWRNLRPLRYEQESHLKNVRQLTLGGDNAEAEAYFSFDNKLFTLQVTNDAWGTSCDQVFYIPTTGAGSQKPPMVSTGKGNTTCSFFMPGNQQILYASTHLAADTCLTSPRVVDGKYEHVFLHEYENGRDLWQGLNGYFKFYNEERFHQSLGYKTPKEVFGNLKAVL